MNKFSGIVLGLILLLAPIYGWITNWQGLGTAALTFFKGGLVWMLILMGALMLFSGLSSLKE